MAFRNVARNWNRTGLIILSMAIASGMITVTLALGTGYAEGVALPWRQVVGADILIYPNRFVFAGSGAGTDVWEWRQLAPDLATDATFFHPALSRGYLSPASAPPPVFDLATLPEALAAVDGVASVTPGRLLAAYLDATSTDGTVERTPVVLRGRDVAADTAHWNVPDVVSGDYLALAGESGGGEGPDVALVNGHAPVLSDLVDGQAFTLEVPAAAGNPVALPILDPTSPRSYSFVVGGHYDFYLGEGPIHVAIPQPPGEQNQAPAHWATYIDVPDVWVSAATFDRIYAEATGGPQRYATQLQVAVDSMFEAKTVAAALAAALPDALVLTVPQEVSLAGIAYRPRLESWEPFKVVVNRVYWGRPTLSLDVRTGLSGLAFAVAGLLIVANMYILVTQRRREIGVMKALGATGGDILLLFLTEALGYSLIGSLAGFGILRLLTMFSLFASPTSLIEGALLTLRTGGMVAAATVGVAVVFGLIPAREAARTPCASLLGDS